MRSSRVYTPRPIARALVRRLSRELKSSATWLEPSSGDGALVREIAAAGYSKHNITALDISKRSHGLDDLAEVTEGVDFIAWASKQTKSYDVVIANPPYMKLGRVPEKLRSRALKVVAFDGQLVPRTSNYWYVFFCRAAELLKPAGHMAFILPASWSYADYALPAREWAMRSFEEVEVFRCRGPFFPGVGEGNTIVICKNFMGATAAKHYLRDVADVDELVSALDQVNGHPRGAPRAPSTLRRSTVCVKARDVLTIRIGVVSGDSRYFLMKDRQRVEHGLPLEAFRPVLSHSRHLTKSWVKASDWNSLLTENRRVLLFSPPPELMSDKAVRHYIEEGGCRRERYKVRVRGAQWFRCPESASFHGFMSGMTQAAPWVSLRRMRGLDATNTLYLVRFLEASNLNEKAAWAMTLLCSFVRAQVDVSVRRYAQGLRKLEPSDIYELVLPRPRVRKGVLEAYEQAVKFALGGDFQAAHAMCERWIL